MAFPPSPYDPALSGEKNDGAAGILQMYKPQSPEGRVETFAPTRYAGVFN
jgi:hypothetical protein